MMIRRIAGIAAGAAMLTGLAAVLAGTATAATAATAGASPDGVRITHVDTEPRSGTDSTIFTVRYTSRDQSTPDALGGGQFLADREFSDREFDRDFSVNDNNR